MLKKILSLTLVIMMLLGMFALPVSAAAPKVGDKLGDILYSDITAYINGNAIPTSIKNGTTMVVVEDLAKYGFDVVWNGKDKTLKVEINANKKVTPMTVEKNTKPVGAVKTSYVYTDIKTYLSGKQVDSFAISGQTLIDFELLSMYGKLKWDGKARTISLTTDAKSSTNNTSNTGTQTNNTGAKVGSLTANIFKIFDGGIFHMKTKSVMDGEEITSDYYFKNGMISVSTDYSGMAGRMVYKGGGDDTTYMVMDSEKMVILFDTIMGDFQPPSTSDNTTTYVGSGSAQFADGTYKYDEYKDSDGSRFQYFVDGGTWIGMRTITPQGDISDYDNS